MERWSGDRKNFRLGLLCHYLFGDGSTQFISLDVEDEGAAIVNPSLSFSTETNITRRITTSGLAFDGHHLQVVLVFNSEEEQARVAESSVAGAATGVGLLEIEIFSSQTGKWKQQRPMVRLPPELAKLYTSPLFSNGAIHWELGGYLLIHRCLWESEGRVHYCYTDVEGIHIWVLLKEQDHDCYSYYHNYVDREKFQWKLAYTIRHQTLMSQNPEIFIRLGQNNKCFSELKPYFISPCAYNEGSRPCICDCQGSLFLSI
ncbi:hypothetical protein L1049_017472 [Liquidambar formosana]|uniref:F-box protein n=1 Tax=Liquidambar formosana TaxID=63359 RepID=A0AAP0X3R3_LIQFO